jgi:hypothetical protein
MNASVAAGRNVGAAGRPLTRRALLIAWALAVGLAIVANWIIRAVAVPLFDLDTRFSPLGWGPIAFFTFLFITIGAGVYALIARRSNRPAQVFRIVALVGLLVSIVPNIGLLVSPPDAEQFEGVSNAAVLVLIVMHIASAAITIWAFTGRRT